MHFPIARDQRFTHPEYSLECSPTKGRKSYPTAG
jgi:hypothetical protein